MFQSDWKRRGRRGSRERPPGEADEASAVHAAKMRIVTLAMNVPWGVMGIVPARVRPSFS
ncbi:MAG: hypothetical protein WAU78_09815 [Roseiarcus sp.]